MAARLFSFKGGDTGLWRVIAMKVIVGAPLPPLRRLDKEQCHHTKIGLQYFPTLARRLHHCRDISAHEPFDFLTWFEYEPAQEWAFNKLVAELRTIEEWKYVEREVDIRLVREEA